MLTKQELSFLAVLPVGRENARTARELGGLIYDRLGHWPDERTVRQLASDLRRRGHLIASSPRKPYGFYRPASLTEAKECRAQLASRLREIRRTVAAFDRALMQEQMMDEVGQVTLPGLDRGA